ncbi:hypothetical protein AWJ20_845 [Sugiyamaella lignohabitans]|uniref:Fungal-type protein kinase domain-containing protein n=1 Tax=Sugiyamaella lignohabitans TaxID=796027 RepID=A0A161HKZ2_9ASCO|nr:uncharacterized protein AWJ20_845 [Sugiyamaella lignohabitans]ANB12588.1 hypothetical protein AWJ20_845 [Sugiyamaella lignohabitans]
MSSEGKAVERIINTSSVEAELDLAFQKQWSNIYQQAIEDGSDNILTDSIDQLTKKYLQFSENYPNQNFVDLSLGKLHVLDFVGALNLTYPASHLRYENGWTLAETFDRNLRGFYVDEKLAREILRAANHSNWSHKEIWIAVYKFVGVAHYREMVERGEKDYTIRLSEIPSWDNTSPSQKSPSAITSGLDELTPVDVFFHEKDIEKELSTARLSNDSSIQTAVSPKIHKQSQFGEETEYKFNRLLYRETGICSRGETLWEITGPANKSYLLRDLWQDEEEVHKELELSVKAKTSRVLSLAGVLYSETVVSLEKNRVDSTWFNIRDELSIPLTQRKLVNIDNEDGMVVHQVKKPSISLENVCEYHMPRNPIHFRQLFEFMKPLSQATAIEGIYYGFRDAIKGHQGLCQKASILHRNITPRNIMLSQDEKTGYLFGLNGALEFQAFNGASKNWEWGYICQRAFVAMELLHTKVFVEHNFYHDLESFFWCFLWESFHNDGPQRPRRECIELDCWNTMNCKDLRREKLAIASNEEFFEELTASKVTSFFVPALPYLRKLRRVVFIESPSYYDPMLYNWMIQVFDDAIKSSSSTGTQHVDHQYS